MPQQTYVLEKYKEGKLESAEYVYATPQGIQQLSPPPGYEYRFVPVGEHTGEAYEEAKRKQAEEEVLKQLGEAPEGFKPQVSWEGDTVKATYTVDPVYVEQHGPPPEIARQMQEYQASLPPPPPGFMYNIRWKPGSNTFEAVLVVQDPGQAAEYVKGQQPAPEGFELEVSAPTGATSAEVRLRPVEEYWSSGVDVTALSPEQRALFEGLPEEGRVYYSPGQGWRAESYRPQAGQGEPSQAAIQQGREPPEEFPGELEPAPEGFEWDITTTDTEARAELKPVEEYWSSGVDVTALSPEQRALFPGLGEEGKLFFREGGWYVEAPALGLGPGDYSWMKYPGFMGVEGAGSIATDPRIIEGYEPDIMPITGLILERSHAWSSAIAAGTDPVVLRSTFMSADVGIVSSEQGMPEVKEDPVRLSDVIRHSGDFAAGLTGHFEFYAPTVPNLLTIHQYPEFMEQHPLYRAGLWAGVAAEVAFMRPDRLMASAYQWAKPRFLHRVGRPIIREESFLYLDDAVALKPGSEVYPRAYFTGAEKAVPRGSGTTQGPAADIFTFEESWQKGITGQKAARAADFPSATETGYIPVRGGSVFQRYDIAKDLPEPTLKPRTDAYHRAAEARQRDIFGLLDAEPHMFSDAEIELMAKGKYSPIPPRADAGYEPFESFRVREFRPKTPLRFTKPETAGADIPARSRSGEAVLEQIRTRAVQAQKPKAAEPIRQATRQQYSTFQEWVVPAIRSRYGEEPGIMLLPGSTGSVATPRRLGILAGKSVAAGIRTLSRQAAVAYRQGTWLRSGLSTGELPVVVQGLSLRQAEVAVHAPVAEVEGMAQVVRAVQKTAARQVQKTAEIHEKVIRTPPGGRGVTFRPPAWQTKTRWAPLRWPDYQGRRVPVPGTPRRKRWWGAEVDVEHIVLPRIDELFGRNRRKGRNGGRLP